jgi:transcriptional regulator with XRE-family HTH domain
MAPQDTAVDRYSGEGLRSRIGAAGLRAADLAKALDVVPNSVSRWLSGIRTPEPDMRAAIDRVLDGKPASLELTPDELAAIETASFHLDHYGDFPGIARKLSDIVEARR